jgi:hypothetical protein
MVPALGRVQNRESERPTRVPSAAEAANTRDRTTRRFCTSPSARYRRTHPQRSAEKKQKEKKLLNLGPATCQS